MRKLFLGLVCLGLLSCDTDKRMANVASDTPVMKEAQEAANKIVRNAQDCDFVKSNLDEVNRTLASAASRVQTEAGRATLNTLQIQVRNVAQACP